MRLGQVAPWVSPSGRRDGGLCDDVGRTWKLCWSLVVEAPQAKHLRDIELHLQEVLARFGMAGQVRLQDGVATLSGAGRTVQTDASALVETWDSLSDADRHRACVDVVRSLTAQRRAAFGTPADRRSFPWFPVAAASLAAVVTVAYLYARPIFGRGDAGGDTTLRRRAATTASDDSAPTTDDRESRAARVCEQTVGRVSRGATVGTTDTEGWVIELTLLGRRTTTPMDANAVLDRYVQLEPGTATGRWVWGETPELARIEGSSTRVELRSAFPASEPVGDWDGVRITWSGRYVTPYFDQSRRGQYLTVAHAMTRELNATHAGLYARCRAGVTHHLGAWFSGPGSPGAAAALVYFMGAFASPLHVPAELFGPDGGPRRLAGVFTAVVEATAPLKRSSLATVLGAQDGLVTGPKGGPAIITFPFRDGNRATRASHQLAAFVGLAAAN